MPRLIPFDFGAKVPDSSEAVAAPYGTAAAVTATLSQGLGKIADNLAETQALRAKANYEAKLANAQADVAARTYYTVAELKQTFGDNRAGLDPSIANRLDSMPDAEQIPAWAVGASAFDIAARKALEEEAATLDLPGARERFRIAAGSAANSRKMQLVEHGVRKAQEYMSEQESQSILHRVNNAASVNDFWDKDAGIHADIDKAPHLDPSDRARLHLVARRAEQIRPIEDALRLDSLPMLKQQLRAVNDLNQKTDFKPEERRSLAGQIEHRIAAIEGRDREDAFRQQAEDFVSASVMQHTMPNGRLDGDAILASVEDANAPAELKAMMRSLATSRVALSDQRFQKQTADIFNGASSAYEARHSLADIPPATVQWLKDPDNGAVHYWQALEDRARQDAAHWKAQREGKKLTETPEQKSAQFALEADMTDHPEKYLSMSPAEFAALAQPKLSQAGFEETGRRFNSMRATAGKRDPNAPIPKSIEEQLMAAGREAGVFPRKADASKGITLKDPTTWSKVTTPAGNNAADVYIESKQRLQAKFAGYLATNGKPPPQDVVDGWVAGEVSKVNIEVPGKFWGTNTKTTTAADARAAGQTGTALIQDADRKRVEALFKARGKPAPTDDQIRALLAVEAQIAAGGAKAPAPAPVTAVGTTVDRPLNPAEMGAGSF